MQLIDVVGGNKKCTATVQEVYNFLDNYLKMGVGEEDEVRTLISWLPFITDMYIYVIQVRSSDRYVAGSSKEPHIIIRLSNGEEVSIYTALENGFQNFIYDKIHEHVGK